MADTLMAGALLMTFLALSCVKISWASCDKKLDEAELQYQQLEKRLDKLTVRLHQLDEELDKRLDKEGWNEADLYMENVQRLEAAKFGSECAENEVQCGLNDTQCVFHLFFCDGHVDCRNGADEEFCESPLKLGDKFVGTVIFDHCRLIAPIETYFTVAKLKHRPHFTTKQLLSLKFYLVFDYEEELEVIAPQHDGFYNFAAHQVVLFPVEGGALRVICQFNRFQPDRCTATVMSVGLEEPCAKVVYIKQNGDDHEDEE